MRFSEVKDFPSSIPEIPSKMNTLGTSESESDSENKNKNNEYIYTDMANMDENHMNKLQTRPNIVNQETNPLKPITVFNTNWVRSVDGESILGAGGQGIVRKCQRNSILSRLYDGYYSNIEYCYKTININTNHTKYKMYNKLNREKIRNKIINNTLREYDLVKNCNLLNWEDIYIDNENDEIVIVMQQLAHSLNCHHKYIKQATNCGKNSESWNSGYIAYKSRQFIHDFALDLAMDIKLLHDNGYAHLDIKPENIMFDECKWKLIDYGLARRIYNNTRDIISGGAYGTLGWVAPEIAISRHSKSLVSKAADIFAFGLVLLYVIHGGEIYGHWKRLIKNKFGDEQINTKHLMYIHSKQGHTLIHEYLWKLYVKDKIDESLYHLLQNILQFNMAQRPNIHMVLKSKYFATKHHTICNYENNNNHGVTGAFIWLMQNMN